MKTIKISISVLALIMCAAHIIYGFNPFSADDWGALASDYPYPKILVITNKTNMPISYEVIYTDTYGIIKPMQAGSSYGGGTLAPGQRGTFEQPQSTVFAFMLKPKQLIIKAANNAQKIWNIGEGNYDIDIKGTNTSLQIVPNEWSWLKTQEFNKNFYTTNSDAIKYYFEKIEPQLKKLKAEKRQQELLGK